MCSTLTKLKNISYPNRFEKKYDKECMSKTPYDFNESIDCGSRLHFHFLHHFLCSKNKKEIFKNYL